MGETPYSKPTQDLSWADDGTRTEPSAGRKSTGWVAAGPKPAAEVNWRWYEVDAHLTWSAGEVRRRFDTATEAIEETAAGERVTLETAQAWTAAEVSKPSVGSITHLATDGRRVYYVSGLTLYAATAQAIASQQVKWSRDLATDGFASVDHLSTDGKIIALWGVSSTSGKIFAVYTLPSRGPITEATVLDELTTPDDVVSIRCDSIASTDRVWLGDFTGVVYRWTPAGGIESFATAGAPPMTGMAMSADLLLVRTGATRIIVTKAAGAVSTHPGLFTADIAGTDSSLVSLDSSAPTASIFGALTGMNPTAGVIDLALVGAAAEETILAVADGIVATEMAAYSMSSGQPLMIWDTPFDGPIAIAGQHIWGVIAGELVARPVGLRGGEVWERIDASTTTIGRSDADLRLIRRQRRT